MIGRVQNAARTAGRPDVFARVIQGVVNPPAALLNGAANGVSDFSAGIFHARALKAQNQMLKSEMASAALYTETMDRLNEEIDQLRKLQNLPAIEGKEKVSADIIGFFPYENRLTISAGADKGVAVGQPVVTPDGLLGRIQVVGPNTAQVLLLSSPEPTNRIGAIAQRNPPSAGLLRGESSTTFLLEFNDPKAPVASGDLVVTSGFSEHIPRGIPIGRVIQVDDNVEFGKRQARVYPSVNIGSVREVFVLK